MVKKFRLFDKNILFEANFELKASGFSALFCHEFSQPDVYCRVYLSKSLNDSPCTPVLSAPELTVSKSGSKIIRTAHDIPGGRELARAVMDKQQQEIELYVTADYADCFYLWPLVRFDSFLRGSSVVMLHASYIVAPDGKAIIFTAPSGSGKSTQAELWQRYKNARIINGDKAVLKVRDGRAYAYSLPICGTSGICLNEVHEVGCVAVLSKGVQNRLTPLCGREALSALMQTAFIDYWDSGDTISCLSIIKGIVRLTRVCSLICLPEVSAADCLEEFLQRGDGTNL